MFQLLQIALGHIKLDGATPGQSAFNLKMEARAVVDLMRRIAKAFCQFCEAPEVRGRHSHCWHRVALLGVSAPAPHGHHAKRCTTSSASHTTTLLRCALPWPSWVL